jgi:signal transduction histidine kinase/CheY-like chemotaxis protein
VVISVTKLLTRAALGEAESTLVYLFDESDSLYDHPVFLGGVAVDNLESSVDVTPTEEEKLKNLENSDSRCIFQNIPIAQKEWKVVVCALGGSYSPEHLFVILGGVVIFVACICVALWFFTAMRRATKIDQIKNAAESEKAALIVDNAEKAAEAERYLNEYIAHEVRNPLSAAISACSFVNATINEATSLTDADSRKSVLEDVHIIGSSLQFINDLLRSMLDMQKAASNQLQLDISPTDILSDVLEPVATMLYQRNNSFQVLVDCQKNMVVSTDRLRLKQVVLNLASNSRKFVQQGYIKLRAVDVDGDVQLYVEDSGPSIPLNKRGQLFAKFQESLDSLSQGTGMGLCLCKNIVELLKGDIFLDETFDSGVEGCPGARFVIRLNTPPLHLDSASLDQYEASLQPNEQPPLPRPKSQSCAVADQENTSTPVEDLPENLSVLVVDDDLVLRKLISRSLRRIAPTWSIKGATSGETALRLTDTEQFDVIFLDQYMASVEKQMLGTETARALRANGVKSRICGLSANDAEGPFIDAGADAFIRKPFPCEKQALTREVLRILHGEMRREVGTLDNV